MIRNFIKFSKLNNKCGFTLIELLASISIITFFSAAILMSLLQSYKGIYEAQHKTTANFEAQSDIEEITNLPPDEDAPISTLTINFPTPITLSGQSVDISGEDDSINSDIYSLYSTTNALTVIPSTSIDDIATEITLANRNTPELSGDEFTATISWSPQTDTLNPSLEYTATIRISPKSGYAMPKLDLNQFHIEGAEVTYYENSGTIMAVFPPTVIPTPEVTSTPEPTSSATPTPISTPTTGPTPLPTSTPTPIPTAVPTQPPSGPTPTPTPARITGTTITGVTRPVKTDAPDMTVNETSEYTATISWSPNPGAKFDNNEVYTARITITPKSGYTLQGIIPNQFTVNGIPASNAANTGVISVIFPET